jgi:hypothetical protein
MPELYSLLNFMHQEEFEDKARASVRVRHRVRDRVRI